MFTHYQAENSTAEPALVSVIEQGLRAEHSVVTEDDILMELTRWMEASGNDILSDVYQQAINYVVSGQHPTLQGAMLDRQPNLGVQHVFFRYGDVVPKTSNRIEELK